MYTIFDRALDYIIPSCIGVGAISITVVLVRMCAWLVFGI